MFTNFVVRYYSEHEFLQYLVDVFNPAKFNAYLCN